MTLIYFFRMCPSGVRIASYAYTNQNRVDNDEVHVKRNLILASLLHDFFSMHPYKHVANNYNYI